MLTETFFSKCFFHSESSSLLFIAVNSLLSYIGYELVSAIEDSSKPVSNSIFINSLKHVLLAPAPWN